MKLLSLSLQHHPTADPNQEPRVGRLHAVRVDAELGGRLQPKCSDAAAAAAPGDRDRRKLQGRGGQRRDHHGGGRRRRSRCLSQLHTRAIMRKITNAIFDRPLLCDAAE